MGAFASCTKDRVCSCTITEPFTGVSISADTTFEDISKGDAEDECDKLSDEVAILDGSCELE